MALANSLLYELTNNSVERSIELIQLALHSPVYIPQKREIIVSWLCRRLETHKSLKKLEAATLWDILRGLVKDMQPLEVAVVVQDSFLQAIQQQLEALSKISYEECLLETMTALVQKAPQSTLALKLPALVKLLAVTLKQCRHFMLVPEKFEHLCLTAAALMEVFISSWYQHSCTIQEAFVHLKPLLPDMMYLLHMKKDSSSEAVNKLQKSIKRFVHTSLFLRNNITEWLTALYEYLRLDGFNAHVPLRKGDENCKEVMEVGDDAQMGDRNCEEVMEAGDDEMEGGDVQVNQEMVAVLQAEPHRLATVNKDEGFLLEKLMEFFAEVWKDTNFPKKPAADFLPEFFSVFLEGLISFNKTEDLQSNTVLLAYFAHHLGLESPAFSGTVPFEMGLTTQQRLRHLCGLLCTYQATEQYCLVVVMPQFKRSLFKPRRWFGELAARLQPLGDEERCTAWFHCLGAVMRIAPNLVEGSMIKTLRKCWEVCGTKDPSTLEARDRLLESILNTYIELFRIPKLIRNMFSSFTSLHLPLAPSSIPVSFLRRFAACCIDLSPGQLIQTWHVLVNQLKYWTSGDTAEGSAEPMEGGEPEWQARTKKIVKNPKKEEEEDHLPKVLVVTEILYTFACHVQLVNPTMPSTHVAKVTELMHITSELAAQMLDFAIEKQSVQHAQCALSVFHMWGELHLVLCLYRRTYGEAYAAPELTEPLEAADLSFLHPTFTREKLESVLALLDRDKTKLTCHYLMLLWIQKIRALILFTEATNEHLAPSLEATAKLIFSHVDMTVTTAVWSQRVCEVSAGVFPVVSLHTILVNFPLLAPHLPARNVTALCHFLLEVMANGRGKDTAESGENGLTQTKVVTTYLSSQAFLECKLAQTAYVTALWGTVSNTFKAKKRKLDSDEGPKELCRSVIDAVCGPVRWDKYAETVPQPDYSSKELLGPEGLNKMWTAIHGASEKLTAVMAAGQEEFTERMDVADILFMLEALEHLPLESLFPGNQLRCMLGLLSVLFLLEGLLRKKDNSQEKLQAVKCTSRTFCLLLQSPRKSWLLDFVSAGTLISRLVAAFQGNLSQALDDRSMLELYDSILNTLVHHALKKKNTVRTLNSIVKQMKEVISTDPELPSKAHATAALVLFKELVLELCRKMLHTDVKGYIQKMAHTLSEGIAVWLEQLLGCTKPSAELREQMYTIALLQTQYAQCASRLKSDGDDDEEACSKNTLKALSMVTAELQKPEASEVTDTLIEVVSRVARQRARTSELLPAAFPALGKGIYMQLALRATQRAEASSDGKASLTLENCISDKHCKLVEAFFQSCTAAELKDILADLVSTLMQDDVRSVSMKVHLQVLQLVCSCLDGQKQGRSARDAMPIIHRIIEHFAVMLSVYDIGSHPELVVYILKFFSTLLTMRKIVLSHRGGIVILQSLSSLNFLPLWASSPEHFCQAVTAACRLLSIFLSKRIVMVVGCTVAFQACISHLLRSIIKVGGSDQLKDQPMVAYELHMSALSLERLVGEVASHKKEFSKVGGFLIPDYIQESITTVLHPPIKKTLLFLVYKLFSLPDEHRRAMVHATLPKEATEVFKTLFTDSQKLRFKGKV